MIIKILRDFSHYHDPRVRSTALHSLMILHESNIELDISLYGEFTDLLNDEYETARITAMRLIQLLSCQYKDCPVCLDDGEQIRIVDDAFAKLCSMMNDYSIAVRVEAAKLLGKFTDVSLNFLHQTLDKKLMSDLRKKKSAHQRHRETLEAGEWSSGRKWTDDSAAEVIYPETVTLMSIGSCGAFIHGLEDEFYDVRMASLESLCKLAQIYPTFANQSLDFLVDMFNDEIQEIRLKAIQCLTKISGKNITLREDQIDIILAVLEDYSIGIREALHQMLSNCRLTSNVALRSTITSLKENLKRYPCDRESIWNCFRKLGQNNVYLTLSLTSELLLTHPFFRLPENPLDDPEYVAILILIFNAAQDCPIMIELLEKHTRKHYIYLKGSYPHLVPSILHLFDKTANFDLKVDMENCDQFFLKIFQRLQNLVQNDNNHQCCSIQVQMSALSNAINDLHKLSLLHSSIEPACNFFSTYLQCQISLRKIVSNNNWINTFLMSALQSSVFRSSLQQLLSSTFSMLNLFHGLQPKHIIAIQQTRIKAMALQLIAIIHGSNVSALGLCDAFLSEMTTLKRLSKEHCVQLDEIINDMFKAIDSLNQPRPGTVGRILQPIFLDSSTTKICDLSNILDRQALQDFKKISMTKGEIVEPIEKMDTILKFTAGLVLEVPFVANLEHVKDIKNIRIKIQYPDQQIQLIQPKLNEFRLKTSDDINNNNNSDKDDDSNNDYKLMTKISLSSYGVWSGPSLIEINLLLDFRDIQSSSLSTTQIYSSLLTKSSGIKSTRSEDNLVIEISKPVKLMIHPMKPKRCVI
uniref:Integrator complex subunit 4-like n=1 Tax=Dermatophagoides pteronyssinus TaxID=6956 RepID=A0A6P6Y4P9_DERPT|nr:integrator complex subunit 4-like [Dermatophagoides pteronyssinus]